jgi:hypothetical protein
MCYYVILLVLFFSSLCAMESKQNQLEFSNRKTYIDAQKKSTSVEIVVPKPCVFCDSDILATNYIVNENKEDDVRVIMNKFPYFHPSQGVHFLIMPISHKEQLSEL